MPRAALALFIFVAFGAAARLWLLLGGDPIRVRGRWLRWGARIELAVLGISLSVEGASHLARPGPMIIIANHGSLLDVLVFGALLPRPVRALLRREFTRIPLLGPVLRDAGHILVDRGRAPAAALSLRAAARALAAGEVVLIFPEGARQAHGTIGLFHAGAFRLALRSRAPIVPVSVSGATTLWPRGASFVRSGTVRVLVGSPIDTRSWTRPTLSAHIEQLRAAIAAPFMFTNP
jgi:1-acyl-sn-glycerol-3-phosphate acyltransferase